MEDVIANYHNDYKNKSEPFWEAGRAIILKR